MDRNQHPQMGSASHLDTQSEGLVSLVTVPHEEEGELLRSIPDPLHRQMSERMRARITSGVWPAHYKLRAEPELAVEFGVSRGTLRRALRTLIDEGLLVQVHGKGTFVTPHTIEPAIVQEFLSLAEGFSQLGIQFETTVLANNIVPPPSRVRALLDIPTGAGAFRLERVRSIAGTPVAHLVNYVPVALCPGIEKCDFTQKTLFGVIENEYHQPIASGRRTFDAQGASQDVSRALQIPEGSPVLYLEQVAYLSDGRPIEYSDVWMRGGDRLKLSSVVRRL